MDVPGLAAVVITRCEEAVVVVGEFHVAETEIVAPVDEDSRRRGAEAALVSLVVAQLSERVREVVGGARTGDLETGDLPVAGPGGLHIRAVSAGEAEYPALLVARVVGRVALRIDRPRHRVLAVQNRALAAGALDADDADGLSRGAGASEVDLLVVVAALFVGTPVDVDGVAGAERLPRNVYHPRVRLPGPTWYSIGCADPAGLPPFSADAQSADAAVNTSAVTTAQPGTRINSAPLSGDMSGSLDAFAARAVRKPVCLSELRRD